MPPQERLLLLLLLLLLLHVLLSSRIPGIPRHAARAGRTSHVAHLHVSQGVHGPLLLLRRRCLLLWVAVLRRRRSVSPVFVRADGRVAPRRRHLLPRHPGWARRGAVAGVSALLRGWALVAATGRRRWRILVTAHGVRMLVMVMMLLLLLLLHLVLRVLLVLGRRRLMLMLMLRWRRLVLVLVLLVWRRCVLMLCHSRATRRRVVPWISWVPGISPRVPSRVSSRVSP